MGYRNYLYVGNKENIQKFAKMNKIELWNSIDEKFKTDYDKKCFEEDGYVSRFSIFESHNIVEVIELGSYIDFSDRIGQHLEPLFVDEDTQKYFNEETEIMYAKPEILQEIATIFREKIQAYYQNLMTEKSSNKYDKRTQFERLLESAKSNLTWATNLDKPSKNEWRLGGGWLYEHEIFNILYIMKKFDTKTQSLLWVGY